MEADVQEMGVALRIQTVSHLGWGGGVGEAPTPSG